jgi:hypothetical protein
MTYSTELNKYSRTRIAYCKIITGYCDEVFGSAPCTASGTPKCFNTFPTCQDTANFNKTTKEYEFISADLPHSTIKDYFPAKPYIVTDNVSSLPTEIKATDTVIKRLKIEFKDEPDNDVGIDPYRADRTTITGTFWKKFVARNKNYKGNIIEYYEGFPGLTLANFEMKFAGRIENITIKEGGAVVEATDMLKKLSEIDYPLKTDVYVAADIPMMFDAASEDAMLALNAQYLDYCTRTDFKAISGVTPSVGSGGLEQGTWAYVIVAYDSVDKPFAKYESIIFCGSALDDNSIELTWTAVTDADHYFVYYRLNPSGTWQRHVSVPTATASIISPTGLNQLEAPEFAELVYYLSGTDPSDIGDWAEVHGALTIGLSAAINSDTSGYLKIDKEVIYFGGRSSGTYSSIERAQGGSDAARHTANTRVELLLQESPDDGFTHAKALLALGGIDSAYIDDNFDEYAYGEELITNGTFDADSDWTKGTGWSISGGEAHSVAAGWYSIYQNIGLAASITYHYSIDVTAVTSGAVRLRYYNGSYQNILTISSPGTYTGNFTPTGSVNGNFYIQTDGTGFVGSVDNATIRVVGAGSTIQHSTNVIFKKTKLSEIYFDLVNALDCMSWVGEGGKIKILKHSEIPTTIPALTDEANIIKGSDDVDLNEESRKTRWLLYWNRWDVEKGLKDKEAYNRLTMAIDTVAESADEYNDEIEDVQYTTWINTDSDTSGNIASYLTDLLASRKARTRDALPIYTCAVELKDNDILTGDIVLISTDMLQDEHGADYAGVAFQLIKKNPQGNKIQMKFIRKVSPEGVLLLETGDSLLLETGFEIITKIF